MEKRRINFWLMLLVGIAAFAWLLAELVRVVSQVVGRSGFPSVPLDGVVQHKVGELMVGAPLFLVALFGNSWPEEKLLALVSRTRGLMIAGGLLNGLAWYSMRERVAWDSFLRVWCVVLLLVGLFGAKIAAWVVGKAKEKSRA